MCSPARSQWRSWWISRITLTRSFMKCGAAISTSCSTPRCCKRSSEMICTISTISVCSTDFSSGRGLGTSMISSTARCKIRFWSENVAISISCWVSFGTGTCMICSQILSENFSFTVNLTTSTISSIITGCTSFSYAVYCWLSSWGNTRATSKISFMTCEVGSSSNCSPVRLERRYWGTFNISSKILCLDLLPKKINFSDPKCAPNRAPEETSWFPQGSVSRGLHALVLEERSPLLPRLPSSSAEKVPWCAKRTHRRVVLATSGISM